MPARGSDQDEPSGSPADRLSLSTRLASPGAPSFAGKPCTGKRQLSDAQSREAEGPLSTISGYSCAGSPNVRQRPLADIRRAASMTQDALPACLHLASVAGSMCRGRRVTTPKRSRQDRLGDQLASFVRSAGRKAQPGRDPNDRDYSVELQRALRRMPADEIDALLNGEPVEKPE